MGASSVVDEMQGWLREREDALLEDLRALLRFRSLLDEASAGPGAPFGSALAETLEHVLGRCEAFGWRTVNLDGYAGYAEFGPEGEGPLVMVLGHLDVVPVGSGWSVSPFGAERVDGYVVSRGAIDDKGPTMAALYAARALAACEPPEDVRVRLVFGCDEETGFRCVKHYKATSELPSLGIAPDSRWPLIHAEKGIADWEVACPRPGGPFDLLEIRGGERSNIVIDRCEARVRVDPSLRSEIEARLERAWDQNLETRWEDDVLHVDARGKAAHGSFPYGGDSAAVRALRFLRELAPIAQSAAYDDLFRVALPNGEGLGVASVDVVSGALSANLGVIETRGADVVLTMNIRYPVTGEHAALLERGQAHLSERGYRLLSAKDNPPLYMPREHPLVDAICEVHAAELGGPRMEPGVMGGGTYARALPNTVSVGTGWAGDGPAHEADEKLKVEHLFRMSRIYAHILHRMVEIARQQGA